MSPRHNIDLRGGEVGLLGLFDSALPGGEALGDFLPTSYT